MPASSRTRRATWPARCMCKDNTVVLGGEITTNAKSNYEEIARRAIREIGYTDPAEPFCADSVQVLILLSQAVRRDQPGRRRWRPTTDGAGRRRPGHHVRLRQRREPRADAAADSAGAQAHQGPRRRPPQRARRWLRPDAKSQVSVVYRGQHAGRVATVLDLHAARRRRSRRPRSPTTCGRCSRRARSATGTTRQPSAS